MDEYALIQKLTETLEQIREQIEEGRQKSARLSQHIVQFEQASASLESIRESVARFIRTSSDVSGEMTNLSHALAKAEQSERSRTLTFDATVERVGKAAMAVENATRQRIRVSLLWTAAIALVFALIVGGVAFFEGRATGLAVGLATTQAKAFDEGRNQGFGEGVAQGRRFEGDFQKNIADRLNTMLGKVEGEMIERRHRENSLDEERRTPKTAGKPHSQPDAPSPRPAYHVQAAASGIAILQDSSGNSIRVENGETVPGWGIISAITQDGSGWVVHTEHGNIRE